MSSFYSPPSLLKNNSTIPIDRHSTAKNQKTSAQTPSNMIQEGMLAKLMLASNACSTVIVWNNTLSNIQPKTPHTTAPIRQKILLSRASLFFICCKLGLSMTSSFERLNSIRRNQLAKLPWREAKIASWCCPPSGQYFHL